MKFSFIRQNDHMDCGPACLSMVAKFYGKEISIQKILAKAGIGKAGVNLLGLSDAAEYYGLRTRAVKISISNLIQSVKLPAILHWNQNHFVVLYKIKKLKFYVADPAKGLIIYNKSEFITYWTSQTHSPEISGVALLIEPTIEFTRLNSSEHATNKITFSNIITYLSPYKKYIVQLVFGLAAASLLQMFFPFLTQSIVDTGVNTANIHFIYIVLFAQFALFIGRLTIEFIRSWILLHISTRINLSILTDFLIKLMKLPVSFFDSKHTGDILQRMNDHSRIETFLTGSSLNVLFALLNLIVFSITLVVFNIKIFMLFFIATIFYSFWVILFLKKRKQLDYKRFAVSSKEQSLTIQLVQGMQEIKLNSAEKSMRWKWEKYQAQIFNLNVKSLSLSQWQQAGAFFINEGKNIFITFIAAKSVIDGEMTLGAMLAVQYIIGQLNSPIEQLIGFIQNLQNAKLSLNRLNEIHDLEDEEPVSQNLLQAVPLFFKKQISGGSVSSSESEHTLGSEDILADIKSEKVVIGAGITIRNMSFSYPGTGGTKVLSNLCCFIPKGKTTAIVGLSGSGKTTLLKLLLRFYEPDTGQISVDNYMLNKISHRYWRSKCGVVMQDSFIFSDSIARNVAIGFEEIDYEKLEYAFQIANISDFVSNLPQGINTNIGSEGIGLSMGQRQRILIARAVYKNPDIVFLDEATNSLDANNEGLILNNLHSFFKGRTVIVVAHRLSTIKNADQIVVLKNGEISEIGSHHDLLQKNGDYHALIKNQLELES